MTDFEYIMKQVKFFHYKGWEDGELRKCVDMLPNLSRQELVSLYRSKWLSNEKTIKETIFNILFKDQIGKREVRIKEMDIDQLIEEFKDKKVEMSLLSERRCEIVTKPIKTDKRLLTLSNVAQRATSNGSKPESEKSVTEHRTTTINGRISPGRNEH